MSEKESQFGDFEEVKQESQEKDKKPQGRYQGQQGQQSPSRVRAPRDKELIGIIVQRLGGNRMDVKTTDGKTRNCRVPGRYRRRLWLRPRDIILIIPWEYDDSKGDIVYKYPPAAVKQLRKQGILDNLNDEF